jgi:hypothetical protein
MIYAAAPALCDNASAERNVIAQCQYLADRSPRLTNRQFYEMLNYCGLAVAVHKMRGDRLRGADRQAELLKEAGSLFFVAVGAHAMGDDRWAASAIARSRQLAKSVRDNAANSDIRRDAIDLLDTESGLP